MSNSINGSNYLYSYNGTVGALKGSKEAQESLQNGKKEGETVEINGQTYIIFSGCSGGKTLNDIAKGYDPNVFANQFVEGNLTVDELKIALSKVGVDQVNVKQEGNKIIVEYKARGQQVILKCTTEAAKSQTDSAIQTFVNLDNRLSQADIDKFYDAVEFRDGIATKYVLKSGCTQAQIDAAARQAQEKVQQKLKNASYIYDFGQNGNSTPSVHPNPKSSNLNYSEQQNIKNGRNNYEDILKYPNSGVYRAVEDLSVEQFLAVNYGPSKMPTPEIKKWFSSHGVSSYSIETEGSSGKQVVSFKYNGKDYKIQSGCSYEYSCSYECSLGDLAKLNPVYVSSASQLKAAMEKDPTSVIILKNDIDMSGINWTPIENFSGALCGAGYKIKNLTVTSDDKNAGLIGTLTGTVRDVTFQNMKVVCTSNNNQSNAGVVAGEMKSDENRLFKSSVGTTMTQKEAKSQLGKDSILPEGTISMTIPTTIQNVKVENSNVSGAANSGAVVGSSTQKSNEKFEVKILDVKASGNTVSANYATGGIAGKIDGIQIKYPTTDYSGEAHVSNTTLNGGVFAGGISGAADNELYTDPFFTGGHGDGFVGTGERTLRHKAGGKVENLTINGEKGKTLAAGGDFGRMQTPNSEEYETTLQIGVIPSTKNIDIYDVYASGQSIGWCCEVDPETGKVTKDCDSPYSLITKDKVSPPGGANFKRKASTRDMIGRSGNTPLEAIQNKGTDVSFNVQEFFAEIDAFALQNNLQQYKGFKHLYVDSNGNRYYAAEPDGRIMCNTYENAIDAYKIWVEDRVKGHNISIYGDYSVDSLYTNPFLNSGATDICDPEGVHQVSAWREILEELGAVDVFTDYKARTKYNDDGLEYGNDVPIDYYYITADGKWHKFSAYNFYYKDNKIDGKEKKDIDQISGYKKEFSSVAEVMKSLNQAKSLAELDKSFSYYIEDLEEEQVMAAMGVLTGQPPSNQGFVNDGIDGFVQELDRSSVLDGIPLDPHPENATFEDYKDVYILTNFLDKNIYNGINPTIKQDVYSGKWVLAKYDKEGNFLNVFSNNPEKDYKMVHGAYVHTSGPEHIHSYEPGKFEFDSVLSMYGVEEVDADGNYIDWYFIPDESVKEKEISALSSFGGQVELTKENFDLYKDKITLYDKDELRKLAIEKLQKESWRMIGQAAGENYSDPQVWVTELMNALGVDDFNWTPGVGYRSGGQLGYTYAHASFSLDGHSYVIPFAYNYAYDKAEIFTTEDVEELRPYLNDDIINDTFYNMSPTAQRGSWNFAPLLSVDGKIQSWLYISNNEALRLIPYGDGQRAENDIGNVFTHSARFLCTDEFAEKYDNIPAAIRDPYIFKDLVKYLDVEKIMTSYKQPDTKAIDWSYYDLTALGLNNDVIEYYFGVNKTGIVSFRYHNDRDMGLPMFLTRAEFEAYAKSHDLNSEFAQAKANKEAITAKREADATAKKTETDKKDREVHSKEFAEKYLNQFVGFEEAKTAFANAIKEYQTQYINGNLIKINFEGLVYKTFEAIKTKFMNDKEDDVPQIKTTASEYKQTLMQYVKTLGLSYDSKTGLYGKYDGLEMKYYIWNPYANGGKGDIVIFNGLVDISVANDNDVYRSNSQQIARQVLIHKLLAAFKQGLNFTGDINKCVDNNGNVYIYDEKSDKYIQKK